MNREVSQPGTAGDDLDQLLGAYFRAEMPDPWPAVPTPPVRELLLSQPLRRSVWRLPLTRSRLALAASVALLLGSLLLLGGIPQGSVAGKAGPVGLSPGEATRLPLPLPLPPSEDDKPPLPILKNVESSLSLEQGGDGTGINVTVKELPPEE